MFKIKEIKKRSSFPFDIGTEFIYYDDPSIVYTIYEISDKEVYMSWKEEINSHKTHYDIDRVIKYFQAGTWKIVNYIKK